MLFVPDLGTCVGGDRDVKQTICVVPKHNAGERNMDTLEVADVLIRDSLQNNVAVVESRANQRKLNVSGVLVDECTYLSQGA